MKKIYEVGKKGVWWAVEEEMKCWSIIVVKLLIILFKKV